MKILTDADYRRLKTEMIGKIILPLWCRQRKEIGEYALISDERVVRVGYSGSVHFGAVRMVGWLAGSGDGLDSCGRDEIFLSMIRFG